MKPYQQNWDLGSLFAGKSQSTEFRAFIDGIQSDTAELTKMWDVLQPTVMQTGSRQSWVKFILKLQDITSKMVQGMSFIECLLAENTADETAHQLHHLMIQAATKIKVLETTVQAAFAKMDDTTWTELINIPELTPITFWLNEERKLARLLLPADKEALITELAADGYTAWGTLYDRISGDLRVEIEEDGQLKRLSMGQLSSRLENPNRDVRRGVFSKMEAAWQSQSSLIAMALNHLAGFRLTAYRLRQWDDFLFEPCHANRITPQTLATMWQVIGEENGKLAPYFEYKAKLIGCERLAWSDLSAPLGATNRTYAYDEACDLIVSQMGAFSPRIGDFCQMAIDKSWIEAENRSGKRAGAFCTDFSLAKQPRIFMTFTGTYNNLSTLAHELGHAFHSWVMRDLPPFIQMYPSTLAETASTFNEAVVADSAFLAASSPAEKLFILDLQLQKAVAYLMNIRARFLFETAFYDRRKKGMVSVSELNEMMLAAQQKAFEGLIDPAGYHSLFWASKLHFYSTDMPFYNFPYTFGYLFSNGLYYQAQKEGPSFAQKYDAMLLDTGRMTCEQVVKTHLGIDITRPDFWRDTIRHVFGYIEPFVATAKSMLG